MTRKIKDLKLKRRYKIYHKYGNKVIRKSILLEKVEGRETIMGFYIFDKNGKSDMWWVNNCPLKREFDYHRYYERTSINDEYYLSKEEAYMSILNAMRRELRDVNRTLYCVLGRYNKREEDVNIGVKFEDLNDRVKVPLYFVFGNKVVKRFTKVNEWLSKRRNYIRLDLYDKYGNELEDRDYFDGRHIFIEKNELQGTSSQNYYLLIEDAYQAIINKLKNKRSEINAKILNVQKAFKQDKG